MARRLLGIDFGTGGAKASVIDGDDGEVLSYAFREYPISHPKPGWSEHDAENYWSVACGLIQEVLRSSQSSPAAIVGVAVSSALPSMVLVDRAGEPVAAALNLMDRRAVDEVDLVRELIGETVIESVNANRIEDHPSLVNLLWFKRHRPEVYGKVHKVLTIDGFVASRLTGRFTVNTCAAVFYGVAYDIRRLSFRQDILEQLGVPREVLPDLCDGTEVIGQVTGHASQSTGLSAGTPVVGGQVDCNAGWLAGGAIEAGDMQLNLGTCGVLGVVHRQTEFLASPAGLRMVNIPYTTSPSDTYAAVAVTTTGGQVLRYLRDTFATAETELERKLDVSAYDLITLQAGRVPPGSEGLLALPYLMGERSPIWDASARGTLVGLSLHHGRGHVFRAFMEGVAYALYDSFSVLRDSGLDTSGTLVCNEGGAKSDLWRGIITDVLGVPTELLESRAGAPLGDAILAGVGVGVFKSFEIARERAIYRGRLEPNPRNHDVYMEYFALYKSVYAHLREDFRGLQRIVRRTETSLE